MQGLFERDVPFGRIAINAVFGIVRTAGSVMTRITTTGRLCANATLATICDKAYQAKVSEVG
jgi:hypothetical protein